MAKTQGEKIQIAAKKVPASKASRTLRDWVAGRGNKTVEELYQRHIKPLPVADQLGLLALMAQELAAAFEEGRPSRRRFWREIRGILPHPLCGEDAQQWVSHTRQEADKYREEQREQGL